MFLIMKVDEPSGKPIKNRVALYSGHFTRIIGFCYHRHRSIRLRCLKLSNLFFLVSLNQRKERKLKKRPIYSFPAALQTAPSVDNLDEIMTKGRCNLTLFYITQTIVDGPFDG